MTISIGGAGSPSDSVAWAKAYLSTKWHLDPSSIQLFGHNWHRLKIGGCASLRGAGFPSNTVAWAEAYLCTKMASWFIQPFATIDMGWKVGRVAVPFFGAGRAQSPSNTMLPVPRPTSVPSGILIHLAIWPQKTWAKNWQLCRFWKFGLGPHLTQCGLGQGLPPCHASSWSIQPFGHRQDRQTDNGPTAQSELFYKWSPKIY